MVWGEVIPPGHDGETPFAPPRSCWPESGDGSRPGGAKPGLSGTARRSTTDLYGNGWALVRRSRWYGPGSVDHHPPQRRRWEDPQPSAAGAVDWSATDAGTVGAGGAGVAETSPRISRSILSARVWPSMIHSRRPAIDSASVANGGTLFLTIHARACAARRSKPAASCVPCGPNGVSLGSPRRTARDLTRRRINAEIHD